jgi:hypothetical protein
MCDDDAGGADDVETSGVEADGSARMRRTRTTTSATRKKRG